MAETGNSQTEFGRPGCQAGGHKRLKAGIWRCLPSRSPTMAGSPLPEFLVPQERFDLIDRGVVVVPDRWDPCAGVQEHVFAVVTQRRLIPPRLANEIAEAGSSTTGALLGLRAQSRYCPSMNEIFGGRTIAINGERLAEFGRRNSEIGLHFILCATTLTWSIGIIDEWLGRPWPSTSTIWAASIKVAPKSASNSEPRFSGLLRAAA